jgi:TniQ
MLLLFNDPGWQATFPHRVTPLYEESFAGLLLRCDEENHWGNGATWDFLKRESDVKNVALLPYLSVPYLRTAELLSEKVALPMKDILATTYLLELKRCLDIPQPLPGDLRASSKFRICPSCLEESHFLKKTLSLPYIVYCPWHETMLLSTCQCGASLELFYQDAVPFTCFHCGLAWEKLPKLYPSPERIVVTRQILSCWDWVIYNGNPRLLKDVFQSIVYMMKRQIIRNRGRHEFLIILFPTPK